ncbi:hypothetical protein EHF33_16245 (plasmid) [Deinococcus psychrotolerans]|uniref:Molecular chaperone n=1 Tax=Deinococcus psychrotolerans TaxID=2489213 RepID=A0A3G8YHL5_9DEIO|nr:hypothetical protein [Deinococcus psychrotolerans]AZI44465.1 hypothetical protein EHF33_16245 [Deinococcus psychrotolerans]
MRRLFALLTSLLLAAPISAQGTVGVDPVARLFTAKPGDSITQDLNIYNPNADPASLRVAVYLSDMDISETGETKYLSAGTLPESLKNWMTFSPTSLDLGGQQTQNVRYTVQVPKDAAPGTHWIMLMLEGQDAAPVPGKTLASFRLRVAHTVYVNVEPIKRSGEISGIFDQVPQTADRPYTIGVQYRNTGNAVSGVQGRVELRDAGGERIATLPLNLDVALPNHTLLLQASLTGPVPKGQYSALVVLNDGDPSRELLGEHVLSLPFDLTAPAPLPAPGAAGK